jgi:hypothetical protein
LLLGHCVHVLAAPAILGGIEFRQSFRFQQQLEGFVKGTCAQSMGLHRDLRRNHAALPELMSLVALEFSVSTLAAHWASRAPPRPAEVIDP